MAAGRTEEGYVPSTRQKLRGTNKEPTHPPQSTQASPSRTGWRWFWALAGVLVLIVGSVLLFSGDDSEPAADPVANQEPTGTSDEPAPEDEDPEAVTSTPATTSSVLLSSYIVDSFGFHGMAEDYEEATEVGERDAGNVAEVLAAIDATEWPAELTDAVGAFRTDLVSLIGALEAGDLQGARDGLHAVHESQHDFSHGVYGWLPADPVEGADTAAADGHGHAATVIEIEMTEFSYSPDPIEVEAGTPVTFRFTNNGQIEHEAMIGDGHMQDEFAAMEGHGDHGDAGHHGGVMAVTVAPGETAELEVVIDEPGEWFIGCHLEGHFEAGMVATINVAS